MDNTADNTVSYLTYPRMRPTDPHAGSMQHLFLRRIVVPPYVVYPLVLILQMMTSFLIPKSNCHVCRIEPKKKWIPR